MNQLYNPQKPQRPLNSQTAHRQFYSGSYGFQRQDDFQNDLLRFLAKQDGRPVDCQEKADVRAGTLDPTHFRTINFWRLGNLDQRRNRGIWHGATPRSDYAQGLYSRSPNVGNSTEGFALKSPDTRTSEFSLVKLLRSGNGLWKVPRLAALVFAHHAPPDKRRYFYSVSQFGLVVEAASRSDQGASQDMLHRLGPRRREILRRKYARLDRPFLPRRSLRGATPGAGTRQPDSRSGFLYSVSL